VQTAGLQLQDSPPIAIPLSFFLTVPLALAAAGGLVIWNGGEALATRWLPLTLALTHLGTLGFISMVMLGATYQMIAVVVGSPVPWPRLAHIVHGLFAVGVGLFC
jgi:cbb3-type cytochrome oxidase subunit 1